jgi:hypothetical protein
MLLDLPKHKGGRPTEKPVHMSTQVSLKEVGITRHESAKYQQLAKVPDAKFEKALEVVKKRDGVLTHRGMLKCNYDAV